MTTLLAGVDTGGTFTDIVLLQGGTLRVHKVLSTPNDPSRAILDGLTQLGAMGDLRVLVHGSTVATNAILERKGVLTGLITTSGFRDVLEIGRQTRLKLYDLRVQNVPPLVPRSRRMEVTERLNERGEVLIPLDEDSMRAALAGLQEAGVEAIAISLLFSFANPLHEQKVAEAARSTGVYVSASCDVLPEFREYERTSTVVLNAYVGPLIDRYLARLERALPEHTVLRIMQSNGGSISSATARSGAARTLLSGPAAGVVGAAFVAQASGISRLIALDIGGTSTDVALVDGAITETTSGKVGGFPTKLPMIDIHTVGAGGGSIAYFDGGGALRVGPISAGADPGPAAYGRGGVEATVTDAHVVLLQYPLTDRGNEENQTSLPAPPDVGNSNGTTPNVSNGLAVGKTMRLDMERALEAVSRIAQRLGSTVEEAALGIIRIANANMEAAIRVISVERGCDPRDFTLVAFGGAGPSHACELASALRIPRVLIPTTPGVLSALGTLIADTLKDYVRTVMVPIEEAQDVVLSTLAALEVQGRSDLAQEGVPADKMVIERYLDLRYVGQSYELTIPFEGDMLRAANDFHAAHERRFGYSDPNERVQVVNVRLKARGVATSPPLERQEVVSGKTVEPVMTRRVVFAQMDSPVTYEVPIYERTDLQPGSVFTGPAIIMQYDTTTVVPPEWSGRVDAVSNIILEFTEER
jgi:N-methylhydantoinase A